MPLTDRLDERATDERQMPATFVRAGTRRVAEHTGGRNGAHSFSDKAWHQVRDGRRNTDNCHIVEHPGGRKRLHHGSLGPSSVRVSTVNCASEPCDVTALTALQPNCSRERGNIAAMTVDE